MQTPEAPHCPSARPGNASCPSPIGLQPHHKPLPPGSSTSSPTGAAGADTALRYKERISKRHACLRAQHRIPVPYRGQRRTRWSSHSDPSLAPALDIILGESHIFAQEGPSQSRRRGLEPVFLKGLQESGPKCGRA